MPKDTLTARQSEILDLIRGYINDEGCPPTRAEKLAAAAPDAELVIVPGAGHWVQQEAPAATGNALQEFLDGL